MSAAAAATAVAAVLATPAAEAAGVVVRVPDREVRVDEAALRDAADVPAGTYALRGRGGPADRIAHPPAVSLPRVLELAGVAPDALSFVSVLRPNGTLTVLRAPDLTRPAPFPDGPPLVWLDADSVRFLRPARDDGDSNGADNIATAGEDLFVRVRQGALLRVEVRVQPSEPRAGERVRLEARVSGASPGAGLTVRWRFGDGVEAAGVAKAHRWKSEGVYTVVASAEGSDDSSGASEPVVVRVGAARERQRPEFAGGGDGDPERSPATGPAREPEEQASAGTDPLPSPAAPGGPPTARLPSVTRPPLAADSPRAAGPAPSAATPRAAPQRRRRAPRRDALPGAVPVTGVLVAATLPAGAVLPATGTAGPPAAARTGEATAQGDATRVVAVALVAALLALGAWRERRRRRA